MSKGSNIAIAGCFHEEVNPFTFVFLFSLFIILSVCILLILFLLY